MLATRELVEGKRILRILRDAGEHIIGEPYDGINPYGEQFYCRIFLDLEGSGLLEITEWIDQQPLSFVDDILELGELLDIDVVRVSNAEGGSFIGELISDVLIHGESHMMMRLSSGRYFSTTDDILGSELCLESAADFEKYWSDNVRSYWSAAP